MVPRLLTQEQKAHWVNACQDILQQLEWTTNFWKRSSQEMSHGFFNMILRQSNKVVSKKVCLHQHQRRPPCNRHKWCCHLLWPPLEWCIMSLCLEDKQLINNFKSPDSPCKQNQSKMKRLLGRQNLGFASQCTCSHSSQHEAFLGLKRNHHIGSSTVFAGLSPLWFLPFSKTEKDT